MARALLVHERTETGEWRPTGIFFATPKRLDARYLPGDGGREAYFTNILKGSRPPFKDGVGISTERGTWEDWVGYAVRSLGNGHDTWVTEVEPDVTTEATYAKYVLNVEVPLTNPATQPTDEIPTLSGFKKVKPA